MSVSDQGPEANFFSEYRESIIAHGRFVGLFLRRVARQITGAEAVMVGELGGRAPAWKRTPERLGPTSVAQRTVVADHDHDLPDRSPSRKHLRFHLKRRKTHQ